MKKLLSLLLVLLMVSIVPCVLAETALPAVGETIEGFTVTEVSRFALIGADLVRFTHDKTGAELLYIANSDTNRVFDITFRTPALNDKGTPHIFEHSTLSGSLKYPSKALFFNLAYQTYNTYMNASTYNFMTTYPIASLSEAQLLAYADFYTDSCLHPNLVNDEAIFREQAWRYSLTDADDELTLAGTVYSEMLGANTLNNAAYLNFMKAAFPGSTKANESGGLPECIPDLTYEEVCDYHAAYYHPSNSISFLYGSFEDYTAFLKLLDGYFSTYEKKEIVITDDGYTPITGSVSVTDYYPVEAGSDTRDASDIYYAIVCGETSEEDFMKLYLLTTLIADDSSPMAQAMKAQFPAAVFKDYVDNTTPEAAVCFCLSGANPEDAEAFCRTVDEMLVQIAQDGFDPDSISALAANFRLATMLISEESQLGVTIIPTLAQYWALFDDIHMYERSIEAMNHFSDYNEDGSYGEIINRLLLNSERRVVSVTAPAPGLKEQNDAALAQALADVKASMTAEEIDAIVASTAALAEPSGDDASEYVNQLQAVTVSSLPEEIRLYDIADVSENGVRYISADTNTDGVARTMLLLDADSLTTEQLLTMHLFCDLVQELDSSAHTRVQLSSLAVRYLYNSTIRVSMLDADNESGTHPYLRMAFTALDEDLVPGYELLYEALFDTDLTNVQRLRETVTSLKNNLKKDIEANAYAVCLYRAMSNSNASNAGYSYTHYLEYYEYLTAIEAQLAEDPEAVIAALQNVRSALNNANGAIVCSAGNVESVEASRAAADAFLAKLDNKPTESQVYQFPVISENEALILNSAVQYNVAYASLAQMGLENYEGALDAVAALVSDAYLIPLLREQYGVYTIIHSFSQDGGYIINYRDPNIAESFAVFDSLPAIVAAADITQDDLANYVLSTYSGYALNRGELAGAENAILGHLMDRSQEDTLAYMRSLKSITVEDFRNYAAVYAHMMNNGVRITAGGAAAINANADLYTNILDPFGAANITVPADLEDDNIYAAAALFCYQNGLMSSRSEDTFGVYEPATLGDLAVTMYIAVGGTDDAQEALAFWAANGLMEGDANEIITREDLAAVGNLFVNMVVAPFDLPAPEGYPDAAEIADYAAGGFGFALEYGLILPTEDGMLAPKAEATRGELALYFRGVLEG